MGIQFAGEYASAWTQATTPSSSWRGGTQPVPILFVGMIDASFDNTLTSTYSYANGPMKDLVGAIIPVFMTGTGEFHPTFGTRITKCGLTISCKAIPRPPSDTSQPQSSTQQQRGALYTRMTNLLINARVPSGSSMVIGFKWWQFTDNPGEEINWGLLTLRDNENDRKAATVAPGTDAWGYPAGGEVNNYGDFLDVVIYANQSVMPTLISTSW